MALPDNDGTDTVDANDINSECGNLLLVEAGENLTAGNAVYIHLTDGKAYISDTGTAADIRANGIALATVNSGDDVNVITRGLYTTSGLTGNTTYYLGAAGAISTTRSGVRIGYAESTTSLYIDIDQDDEAVVGTIKAYLKDFTNIPANNFNAFWNECDGAVFNDSESPLDGQTLPDLNGSVATQRFLRGNAASGGTGGAASHSHSLNTGSGDGISCPPKSTPPANTGSASNYPKYYEVVWIIKTK
jgi:hypothetical protein